MRVSGSPETAKQVMSKKPRQEGLPELTPFVHPLRTRLTRSYKLCSIASESLAVEQTHKFLSS